MGLVEGKRDGRLEARPPKLKWSANEHFEVESVGWRFAIHIRAEDASANNIHRRIKSNLVGSR